MPDRSLVETIDRLTRTPETIAKVVAGMDGRKLRLKPSPGRFSALEEVWHLRDIEAEGYLVRIRRILAEDIPVLEDLDGDRMAVERRYNQLELAPAIAGFAAARTDSVTLLTGLPPETWARRACFADQVIDLRTVIDMMLQHDLGHLSCLQGIYVASTAA